MAGQPRNITHTSSYDKTIVLRALSMLWRCFRTATWSALRCGVSTVVTKHSSGKLLGNSGHVLALESTHLELKCRGHAQFAPRPGYATRAVRRAT